MTEVSKDKILNFIQRKGYVLPAHLAKEINSDILMASAHLSEMVSSGKLKVSKTKIGGSPVYYVETQRSKLQELKDNLNSKDKIAFERLKDEKVIKDSELDALNRVAMRNIKDFAVPLNVKHNGNSLVFWKWYMLSNEEAQRIMQEKYSEKAEVKKQDKEAEQEKEVLEKANLKKDELEQKQKIEKMKKEAEEKLFQERKRIWQEQQKIDKEKQDLEKKKSEEMNKLKKDLEDKYKHEITKMKQELIKEFGQEKNIKEEPEEIQDDFLDQIKSYFENKNIKVIEHNIVKKKSDIDLIIKIPSNIGKLTYYCKARNKKRLNDGDVSQAFLQAQNKNMPAMILAPGELTKKAQNMIEEEFNNSIIFNKI